ncbi:hypothetical protein GUITHDRAFT_114197 [Guillardia theta CCMP2712]|uniref:U2A'/phosphoprotein 32 family A C-terminal domain-containing protein n=1 Tax=Guillardia theta (strain CCMP2712) TaxID=905079 RepID=L1IUA9_GUITC|nr:hypothetical protein GUITHDRAFT_114197 [Guillardia theta CCMP2712]EKX39702.1 hypothetical protein GUITHDRAFT_114197 [Guillardia theta CCMP2712]|eukprot:XP_005826682.1 hypothetical protein GUITHDRAFT_114197 [Guillardia theta CCMP2712]
MKVYVRNAHKRIETKYQDWETVVEERDRTASRATAFQIEDALDSQDVQYVHLSRMGQLDINQLNSLKSLRFLDLSENGIRRLPDMQFWSSLPLLQVLLLHQNRLEKVSALAGLAGSVRLRSLTAFQNPVAQSPSYRPFLLSLCPSILCLDDEVKNDNDFLPAGHKLFSRIQSYMDEHSAMIAREEKAREEVSSSELVSSFHRHMHVLYSSYSRCRPYLVIQRVFRGHVGRKHFSRISRRVRPCVVKLQKFLMRRYMRTFALLHFKRLLAEEEETFLNLQSGKGRLEESETGGRSIFILPSSKRSCLELLKVWTQLLFVENAPRVTRTEIACCREPPPPPPGDSSSLSLRGIVLRKRKRKCDMLDAIKLRADPSILQVIAFNVIRRRGYKCNSGERRVHATSRSIVLLHPDAVDRILAACSIQRIWRSWRCRSTMVPTLATSLLRLRSARLLQQ